MRIRSVLFVATAVLPLVACSLFTSLDGLEGGGGSGDGGGDQNDSSTGGDGGSNKDGAQKDGTTGGGDASNGSNLVQNPGFEDGAGGCGIGWEVAYGATMQRSTVARNGMYSCELCPLATGETSFALSPTTPFAVGPGSYYAELWLHAPPDAGTTGVTGIQAFENLDDGGQDYFQGIQTIPGSDWSSSSETFVLDVAGQMTLQVHTYDPQDGCFLVDDVLIELQ